MVQTRGLACEHISFHMASRPRRVRKAPSSIYTDARWAEEMAHFRTAIQSDECKTDDGASPIASRPSTSPVVPLSLEQCTATADALWQLRVRGAAVVELCAAPERLVVTFTPTHKVLVVRRAVQRSDTEAVLTVEPFAARVEDVPCGEVLEWSMTDVDVSNIPAVSSSEDSSDGEDEISGDDEVHTSDEEFLVHDEDDAQGNRTGHDDSSDAEWVASTSEDESSDSEDEWDGSHEEATGRRLRILKRLCPSDALWELFKELSEYERELEEHTGSDVDAEEEEKHRELVRAERAMCIERLQKHRALVRKWYAACKVATRSCVLTSPKRCAMIKCHMQRLRVWCDRV